MKAISSWLQVFQSRKMVALLLLGFSSGLPLLLTSRALQAWMKASNISLGVIGLFSLVALPYSLKFLWSPILDRYVPPFLGRRRGWLLLTQIGLVIAIATLAFQDLTHLNQLALVESTACSSQGLLAGLCNFWATFQIVSRSPLFWVALVVAFLSASQDIAVDAYRTDLLTEREMGAGAAIYVLGYRIALLVTGSLAFILADQMPWSTVYLQLAGLMVLVCLVSLWAPEPEVRDLPPASLREAIILPFGEFFQRSGLFQALLILVFIVLYKFGDALVNNMVTPFLIDLKFTQSEIGAVQGFLGLLATIVGALTGGAILSKLGINRSLWIFGALQAISNFAYFLLAQVGDNDILMRIAIVIENFCAGLGTAAFVAFLMSLCNQRFSATQFALLSSLMAVSRDILVAPAGQLAEAVGWPNFFLISLIAAIPGLLLLPIVAPWNPKPAINTTESS